MKGEVKLFIAILVVAGILFAVAFVPSIMSAAPPAPTVPAPSEEKYTREELIPSGSWKKGKPDAPYTLVEFGDYQCPPCKGAIPIVDEILKKSPDKVNFVFHYFRKADSHEQAPMMAQGVQAAGQLGKFWEMHEKVFSNQMLFAGMDRERINGQLKKYARELKLDEMKFLAGLNLSAKAGEEAQIAVQKSQVLGEQMKVEATPGFFVIRPDGKSVRLNNADQVKTWFAAPKNFK